MASAKYALALWIVAIACVHYGTEAALRQFVVEDLCRHSSSAWIDVSRFPSGVLTSVPFDPMDSHHCTVRLQPNSPAGIVISVSSYSLEDHEQLIIEDSKGLRVGLLGQGVLPDERMSFDSDGAMRIHYTREGNVTSFPGSSRFKFNLVFTQVHNPPCRLGEFECRNRKCIPEKFVCDAHNHCGDRSDQEGCSPKKQKEEKDVAVVPKQSYDNEYERIVQGPNYWAIGIVVAGGILAVVVIAFIGVLIKAAVDRKKKKSKETQVVEPSAPPADPNVFGRIRQSLRGLRRPAGASQTPARAEDSEAQNSYHSTPSMYPQLPQAPTPQATSGHDNPEFKIEE